MICCTARGNRSSDKAYKIFSVTPPGIKLESPASIIRTLPIQYTSGGIKLFSQSILLRKSYFHLVLFKLMVQVYKQHKAGWFADQIQFRETVLKNWLNPITAPNLQLKIKLLRTHFGIQ